MTNGCLPQFSAQGHFLPLKYFLCPQIFIGSTSRRPGDSESVRPCCFPEIYLRIEQDGKKTRHLKEIYFACGFQQQGFLSFRSFVLFRTQYSNRKDAL